jgi:DNA-binding LacI/PurR family transcriptional regulator
MVTRKEVAERAGVSPATVSNVINGSKFVSPDLTQRVEQAIAELNYIPNRAARSLAFRRTEQVGILMPNLCNPYYGYIVEGMEEVARRYGYIVSIITAEAHDDLLISKIIERQMDGVYLPDFGFRFTRDQLSRMYHHGVKFVIGEGSSYADTTLRSIQCSRIRILYSEAIRHLFEYLRDLGHRRIVFLSGNDLDIREIRKDEYRRWVRELSLDDDPDLMVPGEYPYHTLPQDGYRDMKAYLDRRRDFTAVFALNDLMALGAMKALREAGLRVPEDVSVVGCDDIFISETSYPPLTTISIPKREIGRRTMELLLEMIDNDVYRCIEVRPELVIRESVVAASASHVP